MVLPSPPSRAPVDGRDHLAVVEFPTSVLHRQQPMTREGRKVDTAVFRSSRYDPITRRRIQQTVTLLTHSRYGLTTPADDNVFVALLHLTRQANNFTDPRVSFTPLQLFRIMGWAPNSRSYLRLRDVLRRLKHLTIQYEHAWWDVESRQFEEEFATGIIANYKIIRQVAGPKTPDAPRSWIVWHPDLFASLQAGSLKRLNLEQLFALQLPTSQRIYRFLDKHFYYTDAFTTDLRDFACGHIGLSESYTIGKIKSKLQPALTELEGIRFIESATPKSRYKKLRPGDWQITLRKGTSSNLDSAPQQRPVPQGNLVGELTARGVTASVAGELVAAYPPEQIAAKLEVFDWLVQKKDKRVSQNPAGYLVKSIRDDFQPPKGFTPKAERERRERDKAAKKQRRQEAEHQREAEEQARRQAERAPIDAYLATLNAEELAQLEAEALAHATGPFAERARQGSGAFAEVARRSIIDAHVKQLLAEQGSESHPSSGTTH